MPQPDFPLISRFRNRVTGTELQIRVAVPFEAIDSNGRSYWSCPYIVQRNAEEASGEGQGATWLQALLLAYEGATLPIVEDETNWEDDRGVEAYVLIPKIVPYSWGYEFYKRMKDHIGAEVRALNASIEERRRKVEGGDGL